MFYNPINLKCLLEIQAFTKKYMHKFEGEDLYVKNISLPDELIDALRTDLSAYNLPGPLNFLAFKRRNFKKTFQTHIDYSSSLSQIVNVSIVLPIDGCEHTGMYWINGLYECNVIEKEFGSFVTIKWLENPVFAAEVEINSTPMVCRVNIPHSAYNYSMNEYRTILSIRLQNNPSFEDVVNNINNSPFAKLV